VMEAAEHAGLHNAIAVRQSMSVTAAHRDSRRNSSEPSSAEKTAEYADLLTGRVYQSVAIVV